MSGPSYDPSDAVPPGGYAPDPEEWECPDCGWTNEPEDEWCACCDAERPEKRA